MNIKALLLIPGAIALSLAALPMMPVSAQMQGAPMPTEMPRGMNRLNLTDAQKAQMKQLREETKARIEAILTPEQRAQMQSAQPGPGGGKKRGGQWKNMNLTEAQKQQMQQIREETKQKMEAILTPEQKAMMQEKRQNWQQGRQGRQDRQGQQPGQQPLQQPGQ